MNKKPIILISVIVLLSFFRLGEHPIEDWDESRHGVNAIEMLQNKDWVNLHYAGKVDDWNLKPPLAIWLIAGSYSIFGTNSWALRIPSALTILFAFFFLYKIIRLYESEEFAFRTCLILASVKGWIGYHVGRTGDTDAVLVAMLIAATFYFFKYIDFGNKKSVLYSALFFGLAFMTKGLAALVFVPSIFLYTFYTKRLKFLFSQKETYQSFLIFLLFPIVWFWVVYQYGVDFIDENGLGENSFDSMFLYDILERFSNSEFVNPNDLPSYSFFLTYLDARFNLWNYLLYFSIASLIFYFFKNEKRENVIQVLKRPLLMISSCWILPLSLFQTFANVQHHWYLAPILPFIAIVTYALIEFLIERFYQFKYVFFIVLAFTIIRQFTFFNDAKSHPLFVQKIKNESHSCNEVFILGK